MSLIRQIALFIFILFQGFIYSQQGCTDPLAQNFDPSASVNNGSCVYSQTTISSEIIVDPMPNSLYELSGMIKFNDHLWMHLDSGNDEKLFSWDIDNDQIVLDLTLQNVSNTDWEDIAQDETHIFIGDIGNNVGNRTDLRIYKVAKSDLLDGDPEDISPEIIEYNYPEQTDFSDQTMAHDFDCEAMIIRDDQILLFTKQWASNGSDIYQIPKEAGIYEAQYTGAIETNGLVTGADYDPFHDLIMLSGYELSGSFNTFVYMIWDHQNNDVLSGNKRKFEIDWPFYQLEAIAYDQLGQWFIANEYFEIGPVAFYNQLRKIDLAEFLTGVIGIDEIASRERTLIFPNPSDGRFSLKGSGIQYEIFNSTGRMIAKGTTRSEVHLELSGGIYLIKAYDDKSFYSQKLIVQ